MTDELHTYRCKACGTIAQAPYRPVRGTTPIRCNLCRTFLTHLYSEPLPDTPEGRARVAQGLIYNPGYQEQ